MAHYQTYRKKINEKLDELVRSKENSPHAILFEAARYSLLGSGKRIRPLLTIITAQTLGSSFEKSLIPACCLELVHTYSLIHDDLPCMDDDDLRRGKPTLHKIYTDGHAVLTGDFLLTLAFEILSEIPDLSVENRLQLVRTLAHHSGSEGMIGGQVVDILSVGKKIDWPTLQFIHFYKTASLIIASIEFGGIISNASPKEMETLKEFGKHLGFAFQIVDDILDVTHPPNIKPPGQDKPKTKETPTAIDVLGLENAQKAATQFLNKSLELLATLPYPTTDLASFAQTLIDRQI